MLTGDNGILSRAGTAKEKTENAELEEQVRMAVLVALADGKGKMQDANLRRELLNTVGTLTNDDIIGNEVYGWQVKVGTKGCAISSTGEVNEAFWEEVKDANGNVTEIRRIDGTVTGLKIGDEIGYSATEGVANAEKTITSYATTNGALDQVVSLDDYSGTWRLLGVEKGRLNVISSENAGVVSTDSDTVVYASSYLKLKGRAGYQNAEEEINRICSLYGKGTNALGARSITVEDINKITGYNPNAEGIKNPTEEQIASGNKYGKNQLYQYGNKVTYEWDGIDAKPKYTSSVVSGKLSQSHNWSTFKGFSWFDGKAWQKSDYEEGKTGKICELTSNHYSYYPETLTRENTDAKNGISTDSEEWDLLFNHANFGDRTNEYYWLASRCVATYSNYANFYVRFVDSGYVASYSLAYSHGREVRRGMGLRPVVSLKSDIQLEKDGNNVWQFSK